MKFFKETILFKAKYLIIIFSLLIVNFCFLNISIAAEEAGLGTHSGLKSQTDAFKIGAGFKDITPENSVGGIVASIISAFLGMLGIIFVSLMVMAGYKWMTANGNEEQIEQAKSGIRRAIYGLIITVSAYAITYFVFNALPGGSGGPAGNSL